MMVDGRLVRGRRSREAILETAVALASVDGLEGLTFGRLAVAAGVSKSGFFTHWPDKEHLQVDVIGRAARQWVDLIVSPALGEPAGVRRVWGLHEWRLRFYAEEVLPGGCFFHTAECDFDDRPGPVRDRLLEAKRSWMGLLVSVITAAAESGELTTDDPELLAFEIDALGGAVVPHTRLLDREPALRRSRAAVLQRLKSLSPVPELLPEE
ncbi:TetR/AcrR family transcriptional regulator [Actinocorallia longicatena]|uniref:TetR family transcriptional regulator n=1 Tax=Actinocorallia longicatena TaxID=111803 RepID=A0ABP6QR70_9ACTN